MFNVTAYTMLCTDLGHDPQHVPEPLRELLLAKLEQAAGELADAGVELDLSQIRDLDLLVVYAAWLYRGRIKQSDKPLMLSRLLHNRQVTKATGGGAP